MKTSHGWTNVQWCTQTQNLKRHLKEYETWRRQGSLIWQSPGQKQRGKGQDFSRAAKFPELTKNMNLQTLGTQEMPGGISK